MLTLQDWRALILPWLFISYSQIMKKGEAFIRNMTFKGLWLLSLWTFHRWGNCNQGLLCDSSLWVSFRSCSSCRSWACSTTSPRWPSAVCQTKPYVACALWHRARNISWIIQLQLHGPGPGPGPGESLFSSKRLLEPIEGLIVVDIVSWQTVAFGIKVSDGERNDPRNVGPPGGGGGAG